MSTPERCSRFAEYRDKVLELFASKGFGQVGMRELAACLGLSPGSLYHHYPSKQHLLLDLIEEFYEELLATLGRIEQKAPAKRDRLNSLIRAHLNLHRDMPWHFRLVERDSRCLNEEQQARVRHLREQYERRLLVMLGAKTRFSEPGVLAAGHAIARLLNSAPDWLARHSLDEHEHDELLENLVSGGIERLLAPRRANEAISLARSIEKSSKETQAPTAI
ncbi:MULTISPECIES: TetR/AcrR family transcriptional regulator [Pseudomonas]|uniref:TetR/AcrR family transcriptional regulator n=1 Tax=Pseudomonas izuensis TaxID=2684212 RepID=A0ABM7RYX1_9PSED|nr:MULTISPECIES: TetR/AcrR family transcriptional regulator [Pseudomonas]RKS28496.1 TetR family transcriptional regulator [Pseudomonas sp. WPR_5_2]BCX67292.1 TetR/AcrR family transcriptional regulator [Pseudomonas izuensis]